MCKLPTGIRRHKSGGYIVDLTRNGRRQTRVFHTLKQAVSARLEMAEQAEQEPSSRRGWSLSEAVRQTQALYWHGNGGERVAMINARTAMEFFGANTLVQDITQERVGEYLIFLMAQGLSGSTINRKLSALSRCLTTAHENGKLEAIPKMPKRREGEHRIRFLSKDEEAKVLEAIESLGYGQDVEDAVLCLLYTGFRCGELWRLVPGDIDLVNKTITVWKSKSHRPRTVPIVDRILGILQRRVAATQQGRQIFPFDNTWLRTRWDRIRELMGLSGDPQFVPHMLRHTCATRLARAGIGMPIIQAWMGHSTIQTTMRYAHFAPSDLTNAAKVLGGA